MSWAPSWVLKLCVTRALDRNMGFWVHVAFKHFLRATFTYILADMSNGPICMKFTATSHAPV